MSFLHQATLSIAGLPLTAWLLWIAAVGLGLGVVVLFFLSHHRRRGRRGGD